MRYQYAADSPLAAPTYNVFGRPEHALLPFLRFLRSDCVGFVNNQHKRRSVNLPGFQPIDVFKKSGHECGDFVLAEKRQIKQGAYAFLYDKFGHYLPGVGFQRHVSVFSAQNNDRHSGFFAVRGRSNAPLVTFRVYNHDLLTGFEQLLDEPAHCITLPGTSFGQNSNRLAYDFKRQRQIFG
ncbi:MAG: hypothetical protein AAB456_00030 [Patescibacteria group bacterium]